MRKAIKANKTLSREEKEKEEHLFKDLAEIEKHIGKEVYDIEKLWESGYNRLEPSKSLERSLDASCGANVSWYDNKRAGYYSHNCKRV